MKRFLYPFFVLFFSGCSSLPIYKPVPKLEQNKVLVKNYHSSIRQNGETSTYFDDKTCLDFPEENNEEISYLAISGGSDKGAYAAGFLNGWSDVKGTVHHSTSQSPYPATQGLEYLNRSK
jgi:hypothetical protein